MTVFVNGSPAANLTQSNTFLEWVALTNQMLTDSQDVANVMPDSTVSEDAVVQHLTREQYNMGANDSPNFGGVVIDWTKIKDLGQNLDANATFQANVAIFHGNVFINSPDFIIDDNAKYAWYSNGQFIQSYTFNDDGSEIFILTENSPRILSYIPNVPYTLRPPLTFKSSKDNITSTNNTRDIHFSPNGSILLAVSTTTNVASYSLDSSYNIETLSKITTEFDLNEITPINSTHVNSQESFTSIFMKPDGTKLFALATHIISFSPLSRENSVHEYDLSTPWDITTASYSSNGRVRDFDKLEFTPNGSVLFVSSEVGDTIGRYELTIPWVANTLSYVSNTSFSIEQRLKDYSFSNTGDKLTLVDGGFSTTESSANARYGHTYSLSTPYNLTTATKEGETSRLLGRWENLIHDIDFNNDGTRIYLSGRRSQRVTQIDLSVPYDPSSWIANTANAEIDHHILNDATGFLMAANGTAMYIDNNEFVLSTPFDVRTATGSGSFSAPFQNNPDTMQYNNDGTKVYATDTFGTIIYEYDLSTPYDLKTASYNGNFFDFQEKNIVRMFSTFNEDGSLLYILNTDFNGNQIRKFIPNSPFSLNAIGSSIETRSIDNNTYHNDNPTSFYLKDNKFIITTEFSSIIIPESLPRFFNVKSDSNGYYISVGNNNVTIREGDGIRLVGVDGKERVFLSTANGNSYYLGKLGIGTETPNNELEVVGSINAPEIRDDGFEVYSGNNVPNSQFIVGLENVNNETQVPKSGGTFTGNVFFSDTANILGQWFFDGNEIKIINEGIFNYSYTNKELIESDIHSITFYSQGLRFDSEGYRLFSIINSSVYRYDLSIPYNIETAIYGGNNFDSSTETGSFTTKGLDFSNDGTKMYIMNVGNETIYQYDMTIPWNIANAVYNANNLDASSEDQMTEFHFSSNGHRLFVSSSGTPIYQYDLSTNFDISTAVYNGNSFSTGIVGPMTFNESGNNFIIMNSSLQIKKYELSTPWDITTASNTTVLFDFSSKELSNRDSSIVSIIEKENFGKLFTKIEEDLGTGNQTILEFSGLKLGI